MSEFGTGFGTGFGKIGDYGHEISPNASTNTYEKMVLGNVARRKEVEKLALRHKALRNILIEGAEKAIARFYSLYLSPNRPIRDGKAQFEASLGQKDAFDRLNSRLQLAKLADKATKYNEEFANTLEELSEVEGLRLDCGSVEYKRRSYLLQKEKICMKKLGCIDIDIKIVLDRLKRLKGNYILSKGINEPNIPIGYSMEDDIEILRKEPVL